jgi:hypothetical protein
VHLGSYAWHPGTQASKCRITLVAVATNKHESRTEGAEMSSRCKPNPSGRTGDNASLAPHVPFIQVPNARLKNLAILTND